MYRGKMAALVCLFVCLLTIPVKAYNTNMEYEQPEIAPRMTYISDADCYFYIEDCVASVDAFVRGYPSTATKCEIVVELQEKSSLRWKPLRHGVMSRRGAAQKSTSLLKSLKATAIGQ